MDQPTVQIGAFARTALVIGGAILVIGGLNDLVDIHKREQSGKSWKDPSFITIVSFRSQGGMKLGFGIAMLGTSGIGVDVFNRFGKRMDRYEKSLGESAKADLSRR